MVGERQAKDKCNAQGRSQQVRLRPDRCRRIIACCALIRGA